jgi:hypothetical protein
VGLLSVSHSGDILRLLGLFLKKFLDLSKGYYNEIRGTMEKYQYLCYISSNMMKEVE